MDHTRDGRDVVIRELEEFMRGLDFLFFFLEVYIYSLYLKISPDVSITQLFWLHCKDM